MYEETPNKEIIDQFEERIQELYNFERLKECDIDFLYNQEFAVRNEIEMFKKGFPPNGGMEGNRLEALSEKPSKNKHSLSDDEVIRLDLLWEETNIEIHRAFGHRLELRRNHRGRIMNSIGDIVKGIGKWISG